MNLRRLSSKSNLMIMILVGFLSLLLASCAALPKGSILFQHTPLIPKGKIAANVGMEPLQDKLPESDRNSLKTIENVSEQVSYLVCKDFQDAGLFKSIKLDYNPNEVDIVLKGELRSFYWRSGVTPTLFLPLIQIIHLLGVPAGKNTGKAEIYLELVNAKTGQTISSYDESSESRKSFTIYQWTSARTSGGEETSYALREVIDRLRDDILRDKGKIAVDK